MSYSPIKFVFFLKSWLIFNIFYCFCRLVNKHSANFTDILLENSQDQEYKIFRVVFLCGHEQIGRFSNLHQCTFKYWLRKYKAKYAGQRFVRSDQITTFYKINSIFFCHGHITTISAIGCYFDSLVLQDTNKKGFYRTIVFKTC